MKPSQMLALCRKAVGAWVDDFAPSMGAAIAYYTAFSVAPLLVIVIAVAGAVFGREAVTGQITTQLAGLIGEDGATVVQGLVASASDTDRGLVAGLVGMVVLLIGATTVFAELQSALDRVWRVPEREKPHGIWAILRARLMSFGLIMVFAFLLMVSLVVGAATAALGGWIGTLLPGAAAMLYVVNMLVAIAFTTVLFAMIFKLMPTARVAWRDVWVGALATSVLLEFGKVGIGIYIGRSGMAESFQAAGSIVVFLAWVYYAAQIFLLGAEFTKVYADEHGSLSATRTLQEREDQQPTAMLPPSHALSPSLMLMDRAVDAAQAALDRKFHVAVPRLARGILLLVALRVLTTWIERRIREPRV